MTHKQTTTQILTRFLEHCERPSDRPLGFLDVDEDVRASPADPTQVLGRLVGEFAAEELVASGVVIGSDDGSLSLASQLLRGPFFVLRDGLTKEPFDLMTEAGC